MGPIDYYNVVIYNTKDGKPEGVQLKALSKDEINQYFDYVRKRKLGMHPIGSHNEKIVVPDTVRFFDFSNKTSLNGKNQANHRKSISDRATSLGDFLTACEEYGQELDMKDLLGYTLFDVLSESSEEDDSEPIEYFNLYIETPNKEYSQQEIDNTFGYTVLDKKEISQYIDLLKRKFWGEHTIGKYTLQVTPPTAIKIFDLSNVVHKGDDYTREELIKMVPQKPKDDIPVFEQFERYGSDITKELFGEEIDILLSQLQFDVQIAQKGINAETGELGSFFTKGNMKGQSNGGSSTGGNRGDRANRVYPKEFEEGILDGSIEPAFQVKKIAKVFANHLRKLEDESGQMVGVFGQWGRGKSYFIMEVFKVLNNDDPKSFLTIKFQAWRYQQTPTVWAYLFETLINEYIKGNRRQKAGRHFNLTIERQGDWKTWIWPLISIVVAIVVFLVALNLIDNSESRIAIKILGLVGTLTLVYQKVKSTLEKIKKPATTIFNSFSKAPSFKSVLGVQAEIEKELKHLLRAWTKYLEGKRILLFVDDLDRCKEDQIIEIIDSLRVILDDDEIKNRVLILVALDEEKLEKAIKLKYEDLFKEADKLQNVVSEYMDKLFISAIKLYPISDDEREEFIKKIAKQINPEDIENPQTGEKQEDDSAGPKDTESEEKAQNGKVASEGTEDSDQGEDRNEDEEEIIPVIADFQNETGQQQNLDKAEIDALSAQIKTANKEITPRQIRIVVYRYLLARNLSLAFYGNLNWETHEAIAEIMRLSGFTKEDPKAETKINGGLFKICQMVVAY